MRSIRDASLALAMLLAAFVVLPARAQDADHEGPGPEQAVSAFHEALAVGDRDAALARLDPEVVIFEGGGAEMSRDEYAHHHLAGDMEFSAAVTTEVTDRRSTVDGDVAWVTSRTRTRGTFREREIDLVGTETMVLRRGDDGWKIVHVHWSSHSKG